jgi:hypothetical protein
MNGAFSLQAREASMRGNQGKWVRQAARLLILLILPGACAVLEAQVKGNPISAAAAAGVGQPQPGPAGVPAMKSPEDAGVEVGLLTPEARQAHELRKLRFQQMKQSVDQLTKLAASLQKDIEGTGPNMLSVSVVEKTKEIEKLARRIRNDARY